MKGLNRLEKRDGRLKGGNIIPIHFKIYGSIIKLNVPNNTCARDLYNLVGGWMNIDPRSVIITICSIGEYRNSMCMELEIND
jgi:hypothetical protein